MLTQTHPQTTALGLGLSGLVFGCDYNPEQWSPETWIDDVALMREAGVNLVAINIFGWSHIQPAPGEFRFDDLDTIIDLLHANGIGVNLGTGTSSPPPWVTTRHPEVLPQAADGTTRWPGGRQAYCPSSPVFRELALELVRATAERYGEHPAVRLWHVSNELGCHNSLCYCDSSAAAFRVWLEDRYGDVEALNTAWGTAFWSQRYSSFAEIQPPRATLSFINPMQTIDFHRFSSDELLAHYRAEAEVIRRTSSIPVTTNFMVAAHIKNQDYWSWVDDMAVIANDHYLDHRLARPHVELAFAADTTRGLAAGAPWILMEHSTSAVNWQPRNLTKAPGEMVRNTSAHVARGADGVCFFQWRASVKGTEKFHSALLPHAGTSSRVWNESVALGALVSRLGELRGSRVVADVAFVFSWENWWAADLEAHPTSDFSYIEQVHRLYAALWDLGVTVDVVAPGASLDGYSIVVVPSLYLVRDEHAIVIEEFVEAGGSALVTFFSGIVDETDSVRTGGYPGAFRRLLGVRTDEFSPLDQGDTVAISDGATGSMWSEPLELEGAEPVSLYETGRFAGRAAVTRNRRGRGIAWYVSTVLDPSALESIVAKVLDWAEVHRPTGADASADVEVVRRVSADQEWVFVLNHGDTVVTHDHEGYDLVTEQELTGRIELPAGGTHIIRQNRKAS
ncbi:MULTISPECIES: beta-galactosidase [unclassified Frondihabitans]|uniref:beta-galactosidase n=1 Tax=unclassified Frondihabitans TaxID=2626248 RepID=UPI000F9B99BA|nr:MULTISPECIES: beta-galactosidase [unclassified Frondihabitans]RPE78512.1 beta-galactosidase [Frondihabitans sp. PhB153]RPF08793.1 beta-galactosidase [Frondihabitans sp. PhB161]